MSQLNAAYLQWAGKFASRAHAAVLLVLASMVVSGCTILASPNSPDVVYSSTSSEAKSLQVPPDLTDISNAEQFVLPGTSNAAVTRNTLLPQFDSLRFVREGGQSWLEFQVAPENVWPQLLAFLSSEKYKVSQTEPSAGVILSQWRAAVDGSNASLFRNLEQEGEQFTRVGFRLERAGGGARLFARLQAATGEIGQLPDDVLWPASSHNPENTSALLNRFMVFLGVEQQRAQGILGDDQARAVLDDAVLQANSAGSELLINKGYRTAFNDVLSAMEELDYRVTESDPSVGRIEFMQAQTPLVIQLSPLHVSAVRASLSNAEGARLDVIEERQLLSAMAEQLA